MPVEVEERQAAPIEVREPAGEQEAALCREMHARTLRGPWIREMTRPDKDAVHLGAWIGEALAGVGTLHFHSRVEAQVRWMAVEDEFRGRGVGSAILTELERLAGKRGAARVILRTNETTLGFFIMRGYAVRRPPSVLFDSVPHWDLTKTLEVEGE